MVVQVAVVVPTHNRAGRLARLVRALQEQELAPSEVVFVDDASADETPAILARLARETTLLLRIIRLDTSAGPAVARNRGWRATSAPFVAFTDDDCEPTSEWLACATAMIQNRPRVGIVQGAVRPDPSVNRAPWDATREVLQPTAYFEGCNLLLRREALEESGGFGECLTMGGEDTWLGWAVLRSGWERAFAPDALVNHDVTHPGYRWHFRQSWLNGNVAPLAKEFASLRCEFWRRWAFRSSHPALLSFAAGLALCRWRRSAFVLTLPYIYLRGWKCRTSQPDLAWLRDRVVISLLDGTELISTLRLAVRNRVFLI